MTPVLTHTIAFLGGFVLAPVLGFLLIVRDEKRARDRDYMPHRWE